ncbi:DinB family protein [Candidatus Bipolaricaulota bacterium]|nr:DinB family protein [Candidatus Bipolaricaulota bacterium]
MYSVGLEIGEGGWTYAWVLDLPGCFSRGGSPGEALELLPPRIERHLGWLSGFEPVPRTERGIAVLEEVRDPRCPVRRGDTRALFAWDGLAPADEEFERDLRWMARHRQTLLSLVEGLPPAGLDAGEDGPDIHDLRAPSVRRVLRHIAGAEYWYLTRIPAQAPLPAEEPDDVFALLSAVRSAAEPVLRELFATDATKVVEVPETTWSGTFTEGWTLRKILRRALWHEAFHIEEIRRHLEGRSGDRAAVGTN